MNEVIIDLRDPPEYRYVLSRDYEWSDVTCITDSPWIQRWARGRCVRVNEPLLPEVKS